MKDALPKVTVMGSIALFLLVILTACGATDAGRLSAANTWPLVDVVTTRQAAYLAGGKAPNGSPLPPSLLHTQATSLAVLRNTFLAALGRPLEPLPPPPEVASVER